MISFCVCGVVIWCHDTPPARAGAPLPLAHNADWGAALHSAPARARADWSARTTFLKFQTNFLRIGLTFLILYIICCDLACRCHLIGFFLRLLFLEILRGLHILFLLL